MTADRAQPPSIVDTLCNAFTPDRLTVWDGALAATGTSVKVRRNPDDGFALRESVAEYYQQVAVRADELERRPWRIRKPKDMPADTRVTLHGGGTLIFDEYGRLKFNIHNRLDNSELQGRRVADLWRYGALASGSLKRRRFSYIHRQRAMNAPVLSPEQWHGRSSSQEAAQPQPTPAEQLNRAGGD